VVTNTGDRPTTTSTVQTRGLRPMSTLRLATERQATPRTLRNQSALV
jgi:hypothetical protein